MRLGAVQGLVPGGLAREAQMLHECGVPGLEVALGAGALQGEFGAALRGTGVRVCTVRLDRRTVLANPAAGIELAAGCGAKGVVWPALSCSELERLLPVALAHAERLGRTILLTAAPERSDPVLLSLGGVRPVELPAALAEAITVCREAASSYVRACAHLDHLRGGPSPVAVLLERAIGFVEHVYVGYDERLPMAPAVLPALRVLQRASYLDYLVVDAVGSGGLPVAAAELHHLLARSWGE